ncbi:MAG: crossover junction endodeoxyribonuclease RuvC [Candidatus Omnitrophica bacterium]|nr:crossover junction endodeoxyribonuclease RuvC [Candidatus Omnitrophota bacterium]
MKILGIDPALTITGYGVIITQDNNFVLVEAGIISTKANDDIGSRLEKIFNGVTKLILDTKPDCLVLEKIYSHYRHPATSYILGQARGVICLAAAVSNIPLVEYAATRVKKAVVGQGLASKLQVKRMVAGILKLDKLPKHTDVTDALVLAIAHSYIIRNRR